MFFLFRPKEVTDADNEAYPVPKELWFLCDLLTSLGLNQDHLFLHPGNPAEISQGETDTVEDVTEVINDI